MTVKMLPISVITKEMHLVLNASPVVCCITNPISVCTLPSLPGLYLEIVVAVSILLCSIFHSANVEQKIFFFPIIFCIVWGPFQIYLKHLVGFFPLSPEYIEKLSSTSPFHQHLSGSSIPHSLWFLYTGCRNRKAVPYLKPTGGQTALLCWLSCWLPES